MSSVTPQSIVHSTDEFCRGKLIIINEIPTIEFVDDYEHLESTIEYIVENLVFQPTQCTDTKDYRELNKVFNTILNNSCNCSNTNCNLTNSSCKHSGNYMIYENQLDSHKELVLNPQRESKHVIYECSITCKCLATCNNRLSQYGPRNHLKIVPSKNLSNQQLGLITTKEIPKGGFVCEYAGEILTREEGNRRITANTTIESESKNQIMNYVICLNEYVLDESDNENDGKKTVPLQTFIDPCRKGNIGRYLNHSCNPNCEIVSIRTDCPIPKLGIFTKRIIRPFEELCFHYGGEEFDKSRLSDINRIPCLCMEENCEKYLPNFKF